MKKSLVRSIVKNVSLLIIFIFVLATSVFCYTNYKVELNERKVYATFILESTLRLIGRPMSRGNYFDVEDVLQNTDYQKFVSAVIVKVGKEQIAAHGKIDKIEKNSELTRDLEGFSISIYWSNSDLIQKFIENVLLLVTFLICGLVLILLIIRSNINRTFSKLVSDISKTREVEKFDTESAPVELVPYLSKINELIDKVTTLERDKVRLAVAKQLAHDIRSPLAALDMGIKSLKNTSSSEVQLIRSAINRIHDIANNLSGKSEALSSDSAIQPTLIPSLIASIVSEKRTEYRDNSNIEIDFSFSSENYGLYSNVAPSDLKRIISNIINNAVEAIGTKAGLVSVKVGTNGGSNYIYINDNGQGMNEDTLRSIFDEGFSSGKIDGTGIGLYHARETLKEWGGKIECESSIGKGATFSIAIPQTSAPSDFVASIELDKTSEIVIVDDDSSIHQVWKGRLESLGLRHLNVSTFSSPKVFKTWIENNKSDKQIFFVDYEFLGSELTGLDLIKFIGAAKSYLITSRFEEEHIRETCLKNHIPLVDKSMIGFIPIELKQRSSKVVFIDDDPIMHLGWDMEARNHAIDLHCFSSVDAFLAVAGDFSHNTKFYIDSNLGENLKGEIESKKIYDLGFTELYLATGYSPKDIDRPDWIKGIRGKKPDFSKT